MPRSCSERRLRGPVLAAGLIAVAACSPGQGSERGRSLVSTGGSTSASGGTTNASGGAAPTAGGASAGGTGVGGTQVTFDYGDGGPNEVPADAGCEAIRDTRPVAPNVLIAVDRSGSMAFEGVDRWTPAVSAISEVTAPLDGQIRFGLTVFPALTGGCDSGEDRVAPALGTSGVIAADLAGPAAPAVGGGTPTAATVRHAGEVLTGLEGTSYLLLLTDGGPNCNGDADASVCTCTREPDTYCRGGDLGGGALVNPTPILCLDDTESVAAVGDLAASGIRTFVIGYDTPEWATTLDAMAAVGDTGHASYFPVSDGAGLTAALETISAFVVTCTYQLSTAPPSDLYVSVSVDGTPLAHVSQTDGASGWRLVDDVVVELVGASCATVSDGESHEVAIVRECEPALR